VKFRKRLNILVTAGPTREAIDPVRFISNFSTGFLGYEIAKEASRRGHRVILISGSTALPKPVGLRLIDVLTARQMKGALENNFRWCNCLIMTAAVGDFRLKRRARAKIKRGRKELVLRLSPNPDILKGLGRKKGKKTLVGFALETENLKKNAEAKLKAKNLDLIVATLVNTNSYPFGPAKINVLIMDRKGQSQRLRGVQKKGLAGILLDSIEKTVLS